MQTLMTHSASQSLWELWKLNSSEIQGWTVAEPCIQLMSLMLAQGRCQEGVRNDKSVELLLSSEAKTDASFKCIILDSKARDDVQSHLYPNEIAPVQVSHFECEGICLGV